MVIAAIDIAPILIAVLGGGFFTGIVALLRFRVDRDAVVITAAQGAVVVQSSVIDALQEELQRARTERNELRDRLSEVEKELEECGRHRQYLEVQRALDAKNAAKSDSE